MRGKVLGLVGLILVSLMLMLLVASNVPLRMLADALSSTPPYQVFLSLVAGEGGGQSHDCDYCCGYYSPDNPYSCWCGGTEGNCVWWGYFKRPETAHWIGKQICPSGWDNYAEAEGLPVGSIPLEKALVIWDWTSLNGSCGHVAYVEDVYPSFPNEYSKFHLSEMNCGVAGCKKERDCFADGGNNIHFIYECGEVPQTFGPGGGVEIENRSPARLSWVDCFEHYDVQLDVAPWHNNACWPREWWGTTFNVTGSSMDLYDFEDPEHLAFLPDGEYWWRIRGYRGDNPSDWSDWQHFLLVNCSPPFTFSPRLRTARVAGEILSQSYFCPSNPPGTSTPVPTETPCPTAVPTATTIPFTKPQLVSPADGSEFNSGDQIVLTWSCPGGRAWSKVVVEREGEVHDSGWTKEFSWESPFNNYGEVKWKAIAKKGDEELSEWSDEWTYHIRGGSGIPPRLIDPTKGTVIQCGNDVLFHWECRSFECQIKTWHPDYDTHYTGWTKWTWWRVEAPHVHPGTNYWSGQGRDEAGNETSWTEAWIFTIQGCTPTPAPTPVPTATATRTNTPWPTVTPMPTNTPVPTATATETLVPSPTPIPTSTQLPTATRTATEIPPTETPRPTNTVRPTATATRTEVPTATQTNTPVPTVTLTSTPVPTDTAVPTATAPSSGTGPTLSRPPPGSVFQSGAHIVLKWNPGPWDQYYCFVEREGQYYNSGWTTNTSWVSPVNDYGGVVWKVKARQGGVETSWSEEWHFDIEGGSGVPPRLIDPTKGAIFQCGNDVFFQWECRSYECLIETWHPAFDAHNTGWTKWNQWLIPPSAVHGGVNYWHGKGRDEQGRETSWTEAWTFTIQGCTPTPPIP